MCFSLFWILKTKKETPALVFFCACCENFKNSFFKEHLQWMILFLNLTYSFLQHDCLIQYSLKSLWTLFCTCIINSELKVKKKIKQRYIKDAVKHLWLNYIKDPVKHLWWRLFSYFLRQRYLTRFKIRLCSVVISDLSLTAALKMFGAVVKPELVARRCNFPGNFQNF